MMYAIMGASGNTGGVAARILLAKGQGVRAIGRSAERLASLKAEGAEIAIADAMDAISLAKAFAGADAVYVMIPPNMKSTDYRAEQKQIADAIVRAIKDAGVKYVVMLSSIGADKDSKTGPIAGLHYLEERLKEVPELKVEFLRAAYFMENTLAHIGTIQSLGLIVDSLRPDLKLPMIAAQDIGTAVTEALLKPSPSEQTTRELLGERDLTPQEMTTLIGTEIGKPDLKYAQLTPPQFQNALTKGGMGSNLVSLVVEMNEALNTGHARGLEQRSPMNTTATTFESFVREEFLPRYRAQSATA